MPKCNKQIQLFLIISLTVTSVFSTPHFTGSSKTDDSVNNEIALAQKWELPAGGRIIGLPVQGPTGNIHFLCDNRFIYTVNSNGEIINSVNTYQKFSGQFTVARDGAFYVGVGSSSLMAINSTGQIRWKRRFDSELGPNVLTGPGGEIYFILNNGKLYSLTAAGTDRWAVNMPAKAELSIGMDTKGRILIPGNDNFLYTILPWGKVVWKFRLAGTPVQYAFFNDGILCATSEGTLVFVSNDGILDWQLRFDDVICDIVHDGENIFAVTRSGKIYSITRSGKIVWESEYECTNARLFLSSDKSLFIIDAKGPITFIGTNGHVYGRLNSAIPIENAVLTSDGNLIAGGRDWIVYGYSASDAAEGWSQEGGLPRRSWSVLLGSSYRHWLHFFEDDSDYLAIQAFVSHGLNDRDQDAILRGLSVLEETTTGDECFFREPYLIHFLERIITQHITENTRTDPSKNYPVIRMKALDVLGKLETSYSNEIYITLFEQEWDKSVLMHALDNFRRLPGDPNGALSRAICKRIIYDEYMGDDFNAAAMDALLAATRYRGAVPDRLVKDAALKVYKESKDGSVRRKSLLLMRY